MPLTARPRGLRAGLPIVLVLQQGSLPAGRSAATAASINGVDAKRLLQCSIVLEHEARHPAHADPAAEA